MIPSSFWEKGFYQSGDHLIYGSFEPRKITIAQVNKKTGSISVNDYYGTFNYGKGGFTSGILNERILVNVGRNMAYSTTTYNRQMLPSLPVSSSNIVSAYAPSNYPDQEDYLYTLKVLSSGFEWSRSNRRGGEPIEKPITTNDQSLALLQMNSDGIPSEYAKILPSMTDEEILTISDLYEASESTTSGTPIDEGTDTLTGIKKQKDIFSFTDPPEYESRMDKILNFSSKDGDVIQITLSAYGLSTGRFSIAKNPKKLKKLLAKNIDIIYNQKKGELVFNANKSEPGFGTDGGVFAQLIGAPKLMDSSVLFI